MKKKKRNRVILAICSMFIACMSIFAFIPKEKEIVKADTIVNNYVFESSDLILPAYIYTVGNIGSNETYGYIGTQFPKFKFTLSSSSNNEVISTLQTIFVYNAFGYGDYREYKNNNSIYGFPLNLPKNNTYVSYRPQYGSYSQDGVQYKFYSNMFFLCNSTEFNGQIVNVQIGSYLHNPLSDFSNDPHYNYVKYIDDHSNYITMVVPFDANPDDPFHINNPDYFAYEFRNYIVNLDGDVDNTFYIAGYDKGYKEGFLTGESVGYSEGYDVGEDDGYISGYNTAVDREKYSFNSLLTAVIDVPVKTFTSLFNFEILGVNLSGFFLGLLTCCIVITIIRLIL